MQKSLRRILRLGVGALAGAFALTMLLLGLLQFDGVSTWLVNGLADRLNPYPGTRLTVDRVGGSWVTSLRLQGVRLSSEKGLDSGGPELELEALYIRFRLLPLILRRLEIREAEVTGPRVTLTQRPDSLWDFLVPFQTTGETEADRGEGGGLRLRSGSIRVERASVRATFAAADSSPERQRLVVEELTVAVGGLEVGDGALDVQLDTVHARFLPPGEALDRVTVEGKGSLADGRVEIPGLTLRSGISDVSMQGILLLPGEAWTELEGIDFRLLAAPLAFRDLSGFVRTLDPTVRADAEFRVEGSSSRSEVSGHVTFSDGGRIDLDGTFTPLGRRAGAVRPGGAQDAERSRSPLEYRLAATAAGLRLESFLGRSFMGGVVDGRLSANLEGRDRAHLEGDVSARLEGVRLHGGETRPLVVSGGFHDGEADLQVNAGMEGLGDVRVSVGGRPLDPDADLRLHGTFRQSGSSPAAMSGGLEEMGIRELETRFTFHTRGFDPRSAAGQLEVETLQGTYRELPLRGGRARASWSKGEGSFRVGQPLGSGQVTGRGEVTWLGTSGDGDAGNRVIIYRVPELELREVDLLRLLGDTVPSRVNARVALEGARTDPGTLQARALIRVESSDLRGIVVDTALIRPRLEAGALSATVEAWLAGSRGEANGRVSASLRGRPFDAEPLLILDSLRFSGIDLAPATGIASQLDGLARARIEGFDPRSGRASVGLQLFPSVIRDTPVDSAILTLSLSGGRAEVTGRLSSPEGTLAFGGSASPSLAPYEFRLDELSARGLNLTTLSGGESVRSDLNFDLSLSGSGASWQSLTARGVLVILPSTFNQGSIRGGTVSLEAGGGRANARGRIQTGAGEMTLIGVAALAGGLDDLRAEVELDVPDLGGFLGRADTEVEARGRVELTRRTGGDLAFASDLRGRIAEAAIDTLALAGSLAEAVLRLETFRLRSDILQADGGGRLVLRGGVDGTGEPDLGISFTVLDLSPLTSLLGLGSITARSGHGEVRVGGPARARSITASMGLGGWRVERLAGDSAWFRADYRPERATLAVWVQAPREQGTVELALRADPAERRGTLDRLEIASADARWALVAETPYSWADGLRIEGLALASEQGRISVDGGVNPRGDSDLTVTLRQASLSGLARMAGLEELTLLADGEFVLNGPAASPVAEATLRLELGPREATKALIESRFTLRDGALAVHALASDGGGGRLTLEGAVPMATGTAPAEGSIDLTLSSEAFDISWARSLVPGGAVAALGGVLSADIAARGPASRPAVAGSLGLTGGIIHLPAAGTRYQEIELAAELREDAVRIDSLRILSGSGFADLRGSIGLERFRPTEVDLSGRLDRFLAWNTPTVSATLTGDLSVAGLIEEPRIAGRLDLEGSRIGLDGASAGTEVQAVDLTEEDYQMLEDYFGYHVVRREVNPSNLMERFGLNLSLSFGQDVWVTRSRQPRISLECRGELRIEKEPGEALRVVGTVETIPERSYFRQFGRRFAVQEGVLNLGGDPTNFSFSMKAQWEVPSHSNPDQAEVVINLAVSGNAERLELTLSSEPEMDEAEIVSYLATGRPQSGRVSSGTDAASLGTSIVRGAMADAVESLAMQVVTLDVVEMKVDPVRGTTLVAGRYVSPDLYLGFRQPVTFSEDGNRSRTQNQNSEVELEYRWFEWLSMNVRGGASELRLFLRTRYAY